ncbi:MAG: transposase [Leptospiraceae bacterium]|nr:transposase [Leptospiraceae bacterium]MCP5494833.1 transposase [Leptospiraceae bacterium]
MYECSRCPHFYNCSNGDTKSISRDFNEELKEQMRNNLLQEEYKEVYKMRAHSAECPTGHIKHNLKFKTFTTFFFKINSQKEKISQEKNKGDFQFLKATACLSCP